jgi:hypothetical protein
MIRVRRRRPSGVVWAVSLMLVSLALYVITSAPSAPRLAESERAEATGASAESRRVTKEIAFPGAYAYMIQFGAFADAENARVEAGRYVARGAAGYILYDEMYRVIGAEYASREDAERVREKLREQEGMDCQIKALGSEAVALRVTASEAQIDALQGANEAVAAILDEARALAYQLDGGEIDREGACAALKACGARAAEAGRRLRAEAGDAPNDVAAGLLSLLTACDDSFAQLTQTNTDNVLSFSGKIKYNTIELRIAQINFLRKLTA